MKDYRHEYRCTVCGTAVRAQQRVELFCVKCKKVMLRWL